jgi:hypothetical protein
LAAIGTRIMANGPFSDGEVGADGDRCALVAAADQVEEDLATRPDEGEVAQLIEECGMDAPAV